MPRPTAKPQTFTVVVNEVPVKGLLFTLARDSGMNVDIHPGIAGVVTSRPQSPEHYKSLLRIHEEIVHMTIEVHVHAQGPTPA